MKYSFLLIYILVFVVNLQVTDPTIDVIYASGNDYELILVAEEDEASMKPYMSALLEFKETESHSFEFTREEMTAQEVTNSSKEIPSIIVKREGTVIGDVSGESLSKQQIVKQLNTILQDQKL
ncbi:hypothetical protein [Salimicrobium flavidum]|uniref:Thioredoxin n=1 Tax=Salimicrobium flavidum TaxID=570947 RepID=A0A1N7IM05_9BACI|nr:hypothetical protein [Salimicrobium flavidum]SIS38118.1 hypothetical protein SAMN05421687_101534 [Salimicrobium flavidum]